MKTLSTQLFNRKLRFDGVSIIDPDDVFSFLLDGALPKDIMITHQTEDISAFNVQVNNDDKILVDAEMPIRICQDWDIPEPVKNIDLIDYVGLHFGDFLKTANYTELEIEAAFDRIDAELNEIHRRGLENLFRVIIHVLKIFKKENIIYGVGRGSSCASYILFILGLHVVDCVKFNVPMDEFYHD